jgi:hypothetical protein
MLIETVLSMLNVVCHAKPMRHRLAAFFQVHVRLDGRRLQSID